MTVPGTTLLMTILKGYSTLNQTIISFCNLCALSLDLFYILSYIIKRCHFSVEKHAKQSFLIYTWESC